MVDKYHKYPQMAIRIACCLTIVMFWFGFQRDIHTKTIIRTHFIRSFQLLNDNPFNFVWEAIFSFASPIHLFTPSTRTSVPCLRTCVSCIQQIKASVIALTDFSCNTHTCRYNATSPAQDHAETLPSPTMVKYVGTETISRPPVQVSIL